MNVGMVLIFLFKELLVSKLKRKVTNRTKKKQYFYLTVVCKHNLKNVEIQ
ncbi:hypothetical protein Hanom_Chr15g01394861 [Helianthus anomalus]